VVLVAAVMTVVSESSPSWILVGSRISVCLGGGFDLLVDLEEGFVVWALDTGLDEAGLVDGEGLLKKGHGMPDLFSRRRCSSLCAGELG